MTKNSYMYEFKELSHEFKGNLPEKGEKKAEVVKIAAPDGLSYEIFFETEADAAEAV